MTKLELLKQFHGYMKFPDQKSLALSMSDTHHKDIFSLVINGTEPGTLTRVFISHTKLKPFEVQLHTHRYPIRLTVIKGNIKHFVAVPIATHSNQAELVNLSEFSYKSPLNGGNGLKYEKETSVIIKDYAIPVGSTIKMTTDEFHTMACSKGSIWFVEEEGFETDSSKVLGVPFITDDLYNAPGQFQINDNFQIVQKELNQLILAYESIN